MEYQDLLVEVHDKVALIRLNRPKALNALNDNMMNELGEAFAKFDKDPAIHVIVLTGSESLCRWRRHRRNEGLHLSGHPS